MRQRHTITLRYTITLYDHVIRSRYTITLYDHVIRSRYMLCICCAVIAVLLYAVLLRVSIEVSAIARRQPSGVGRWRACRVYVRSAVLADHLYILVQLGCVRTCSWRRNVRSAIDRSVVQLVGYFVVVVVSRLVHHFFGTCWLCSW